MLQPDAFCEHTIQQKATAAGDPPRTPLVELIAPLPNLLAGFNGPLRDGERREGRGTDGRGMGMTKRGGKGGEVRENWNRAADWLRPALMA